MVQAALHVLFDNSGDDPTNPAGIDVVAVHGLNFKNSENHAQETWTLNDKLWLRDFLPSSLPKPARVLLFEYNSSPALSPAAIDLDDHAKTLLQWLSLRRKHVSQRPLLFICHSLGGLVVKQALVEATLDPTYKSIVEATRLLVFFATPHRGGSYASVGSVVARVVTLGLKNPSNDLLNALKKHSDQATKRFEQSRHLYDKCLVVSFFEGLSYGKLGIIVDKESAILNLPGTREKQVSIHADHSSICKFDSPDNPACELILGTIVTELERALQAGHDHIQISELEKQDKKCVRALYETAGEYETHRAQIDSRVDGTCAWVLEHERFLNWLSDDAASLLWVTGNPGCGKSVLASFLVEELQSQRPRDLICSFFFRDGYAKRTESHQALCALLHQIFTFWPSLVYCARDQFAAKGNPFTLVPEALWKILCAVFEQQEGLQRQIICIVDALDECSEASRELFIQQLISTFSPKRPNAVSGCLKFLVTSRPLTQIEQSFHTIGNIRLRGEDDIHCISQDVERVIRHNLQELQSKQILTREVCSLLGEKLMKEADGTFLWVSLVLKSIRQLESRKKSSVEAVLAKIPSGLDALYESALSTVNDRSRQLLQCLLAATRPLSLSEINVTLGMEATVRSLDELGDELEPNIEHTIKRLGSFFVRVIKSEVHLVHQTAREFLLCHDSVTPGQAYEHSFNLLRCNRVLADRCVRFLILDDWLKYGKNQRLIDAKTFSHHPVKRFLASLPEPFREFYQYAASSWFLHIHAARVHIEPVPEIRQFNCIRTLRESVGTLCDQSQGYLRTWWSCYASTHSYSGRHKDQCSLHYVAYHKNLPLLQILLNSSGFSITDQDSTGLDVLAVAAEERCKEIVYWILRSYSRDKLQQEIALMFSLHNGHVGLVELLLESEMDVNIRYQLPSYSHAMSPLEAAIRSCPISVLERLVDRGADVFDNRAFQQAVSWGLEDKLRCLLGLCRGQDSSRRLEVLQSALNTAAITGQMRIMDLITKEGIPMPEGCNFTRGLVSAARRGDLYSLERILSMGIRDDGTALINSTRGTEIECLKSLLRGCSYTPKQLENALQMLSSWSHVAAIYFTLIFLKYSYYNNDTHFGGYSSWTRSWTYSEKPLSLTLLLEALRPTTSGQLHYKALDVILQHMVSGRVWLWGPKTEEFLARNLNLVCLCGHLELVEQLVSKGASVNQDAPWGISPLLAAVFSGNKELIEFLVEEGAFTDQLCFYQTCNTSMDSNNEPHDLGISAKGGKLSIKFSPDIVNKDWESIWNYLGKNSFIETPLSFAQRLGVDALMQQDKGENTKTILFLRSNFATLNAPDLITLSPELKQKFRNYPVFIHSPDSKGQTILHRAAANCSPSMVEDLIEYGATLSSRDNAGRTPLHEAIISKKHLNVEVLIKRATRELISAQDAYGRTCLHDALVAGDSETAEKLIKKGASLSTEANDGRTALHEAVYGAISSGQVKLVEDLLNSILKEGKSLDARDRKGRTALHHSILATEKWKASTSCEVCIGLEVAKVLVFNGLEWRLADNTLPTPLTPLAYSTTSIVESRNLDREVVVVLSSIKEFLEQVPFYGENGLDGTEIRKFYETQLASLQARQAFFYEDEDFWKDSSGDAEDNEDYEDDDGDGEDEEDIENDKDNGEA